MRLAPSLTLAAVLALGLGFGLPAPAPGGDADMIRKAAAEPQDLRPLKRAL